MIPKIIHCVWLSGDKKPEIYQKCLDSWHNIMPEYEIKEWSMTNLPQEVLNHSFVASAIQAKIWAYATDYIRLWALYNYGGIYMDLDVMVYKSFNIFLRHKAFSSIEFNPRNFYKYINKGKIKSDTTIYGLNIEAAVIGAVKQHIWIKDMINYYNKLHFEANKQYYQSILMPLIISKISINYGFKYIPIYQVLENDVHIYPPDVFSSCYDTSILKCSTADEYGNNQIRYAYHLCAHSWYEDVNNNKTLYYIKKAVLKIVGKKNINKVKAFVHKDITV